MKLRQIAKVEQKKSELKRKICRQLKQCTNALSLESAILFIVLYTLHYGPVHFLFIFPFHKKKREKITKKYCNHKLFGIPFLVK